MGNAVLNEAVILQGPALPGDLSIPPRAVGLVLFAHGSGSSRLSPRNQEVARVLQAGGLATLLMDLLTEEEAAHRAQVFDIEHLADRLEGVLAWSRRNSRTQHLAVALFGRSLDRRRGILLSLVLGVAAVGAGAGLAGVGLDKLEKEAIRQTLPVRSFQISPWLVVLHPV